MSSPCILYYYFFPFSRVSSYFSCSAYVSLTGQQSSVSLGVEPSHRTHWPLFSASPLAFLLLSHTLTFQASSSSPHRLDTLVSTHSACLHHTWWSTNRIDLVAMTTMTTTTRDTPRFQLRSISCWRERTTTAKRHVTSLLSTHTSDYS